MIHKVTHIEQPESGEYQERIYDIASPWNSSEWTWILMNEEDSTWCGEFRGRYKDAALSEKIGVVIVLTSDYLYVLDASNAKIVDSRRNQEYYQASCTPYGDIVLAGYYGIDVLTEKELKNLHTVTLPINADDLKLVRYEGKYLVMESTEICNWERNFVLRMDCESLEIQECY